MNGPEVVTWVDHDLALLHVRVGGIRARLTEEARESADSYVFALEALFDEVAHAVAAAVEGLGWLGGIWDDHWAMSHGTFDDEVMG